MVEVKRSVTSTLYDIKEATISLVLHLLDLAFSTASLLSSSPDVPSSLLHTCHQSLTLLLKQQCPKSVLLSAMTGFEHPRMTNSKSFDWMLPVRLEWLLTRPDSI